MLSRQTVFTISTRLTVTAINFGLVIFTSHVWGNEGRGLIALIIADISLIIILNNIFSGSTLSFHAPKTSISIIFSIAFLGTISSSLLGATVFSMIQGFEYFQYLFVISFLISLSTSISLYYLGVGNIKNYNLAYLLPPVLVGLYLMIFYFLLNIINIEVYFYAYYFAYGTFSFIGFIALFSKKYFRFEFKTRFIKKITAYGLKNETSYFIQFLNYRLSYFFIASWLGLANLGLFSVSIAIAEAVWIISKSISAIHYSKIINTESPLLRIKMTEKAVVNSLVFTTIALIILSFVPSQFFSFIFGAGFSKVKEFTVYLSPGIIAISISNIYGHYFSGLGKMRVLIIKSSLGLIITILFILILLKDFELTGACITLNLAYITSSIYLFVQFKREKQQIANFYK